MAKNAPRLGVQPPDDVVDNDDVVDDDGNPSTLSRSSIKQKLCIRIRSLLASPSIYLSASLSSFLFTSHPFAGCATLCHTLLILTLLFVWRFCSTLGLANEQEGRVKSKRGKERGLVGCLFCLFSACRVVAVCKY